MSRFLVAFYSRVIAARSFGNAGTASTIRCGGALILEHSFEPCLFVRYWRLFGLMLLQLSFLSKFHDEMASVQVRFGERLHGVLSVFFIDKFHKGKPTMRTIHLFGESNLFELSKRSKQLQEFLAIGLERYIAYNDLIGRWCLLFRL